LSLKLLSPVSGTSSSPIDDPSELNDIFSLSFKSLLFLFFLFKLLILVIFGVITLKKFFFSTFFDVVKNVFVEFDVFLLVFLLFKFFKL
jgi:hypothetical protein